MFIEQRGILTQASKLTQVPLTQTQGLVEVTSTLSAMLTITLSKTQLYPIFNLPNMYQPQKFNCVKDPITTEERLKLVENVIVLFNLIDQKRVRYATYFFKSNAKTWWNLVREMPKNSQMSWTEFKIRFEAEYKGIDVTYIRAQKFLTLTYGIDTVKEYSIKFNHIIRYVFKIAYIEKRQIEKFAYGLDPTIA